MISKAIQTDLVLATYSHVLPTMQAGAVSAMEDALEDDEDGRQADDA